MLKNEGRGSNRFRSKKIFRDPKSYFDMLKNEGRGSNRLGVKKIFRDPKSCDTEAKSLSSKT